MMKSYQMRTLGMEEKVRLKHSPGRPPGFGDMALTVAGRQWTDCSANNRSVNSTSFSNSGKCSISIPTCTSESGETSVSPKEHRCISYARNESRGALKAVWKLSCP